MHDKELKWLNVLLIDDSKPILEYVSMVLKDRFGINNIYSASSAPEALQILKHSKNINLLFIDLNMPGMDGIVLLEQIKQLEYHGYIVIMSGAAFYAHIVGVLLEYFHISKHKAHSHETVLNTKYLLETARCPKVMCNEIQRHFARSQAQETIDLKYYEETLLRWNPTQTAKFAIQLHGSWLRRLWWLTSFDPDFLFRLILLVTCRTCDPGEVIVAPGDAINTLWIVNHGFLHQAGTGSMKTMRIYCRSDVFGEEICIRTTLHHTQAIISRAYTDFYTVSRRGYYDLLEEFPIMNTKRCMAGIFYFIRRNGGARSLYKIASQRQKGTDRSAYCDGEFSEG